MSMLSAQKKGELELNKSYSIDAENSNLSGKKIKLTSKNELIVLSDSGYYPSVISKYNDSGVEIWSRRFPSIKFNDIQIHNEELIALGYDNRSRKILLVKLDLDGNSIWEKRIKLRYHNEGKSLSVSAKGDIYLMSTITKAVIPIKISFKHGIKNIIRKKKRQRASKGDKISIHKLDSSGNIKWKKVFGKRGKNFYPIDIEVSSSGEICALAHIKSSPDSRDTYILKLDRKGNKVWEDTVFNKYFEAIHLTDNNTFQIVGSDLRLPRSGKDSIHIYSINDENQLEIQFSEESRFNEVRITSLEWDESLRSFIVAGSSAIMKKKGTTWDRQQGNWLGVISLDNYSLTEWSYERQDEINDFVLSKNHIITTGKSWGSSSSDGCYEMRLMKIAK